MAEHGPGRADLEAFNRALYALVACDHPGHAALLGLTVLAEWPLYGVPFLMAGLWLLGGPDDRSAAVLATLSSILAMVIASGASHLIDHPRSFVLGLAPNLLDHAADSSFPSDHATLFFALSVAFLVRPPQAVPWLWLPLALVGVALGWARVALGVHFPLDVAGAALIAAVAGALVRVPPLRQVAAMTGALGEAVYRRLPLRARVASGGSDAHPAG